MFDIHEIALVLPDMSKADYARLKDDIEKNGLIEQIVLYEGKILDGRHRQQACKELLIKPRFGEYEGDDPAGYVLSRNLARRHLTTSQRAMVGAAMEPFFAKAAKNRRLAGNSKGGSSKSRADRPATSERARDDAAKVVGVSPRIVQRAKRVLKQDPEAAKEVKAGRLTVDAADSKLRAKIKPKVKETLKTRAQRAKELRVKKAQANSRLLEVQIAMNRQVQILESVDLIELIDMDGIGNLSLVSDLYDDILMLAEWTDRAISIVQHRLEDRSVMEKIKKLEETNGRTEAEVAIAKKLAKKLRAKLDNKLAA